MKAIPLFAGLAGLLLATWLLHAYGLVRIAGLLAHAGWLGLGAVIAVHLGQVAFSAAAWRAVSASASRRPGLAAYGVLRVIREAVNNLLPVAQIGGQVIAARLLQARGMVLPAAIATTVADLTIEVATQVLFTLLGLGLLLHTVGGHGIAGYVVTFLVIATLAVAGLVGAQWFGLGRLVEAATLRLGAAAGWAGTSRVAGLHDALLACYRRPWPVLSAASWHMISWLLGGLEVCVALHFLGHDVGLGAGLVIESLGQALKSVGFAVPGALGVQEGGYVVVCGLFQLSPEVAIALSLTKRLREVALGLPGIGAWQWRESRAGRHALQDASS